MVIIGGAGDRVIDVGVSKVGKKNIASLLHVWRFKMGWAGFL